MSRSPSPTVPRHRRKARRLYFELCESLQRREQEIETVQYLCNCPELQEHIRDTPKLLKVASSLAHDIKEAPTESRIQHILHLHRSVCTHIPQMSVKDAASLVSNLLQDLSLCDI